MELHSMPPSPNPIRTWLQLFRAPNLLTVPGDPLAGYLLAGFGLVEDRLWPVLGASLCFYAGGLLLNDLADLAEDRRERPKRPLPSGAARPATVLAVFVLLNALALWLCWGIEQVTFATGGALLLSITAYNCFTKRLPVVGALNMGLCRGLSMLLGATAVSHGDLTYQLITFGRLDHLVIAVGFVVAYIAAVTNLARLETQAAIPPLAKWLPLLVLASGTALFISKMHFNFRDEDLFLLLSAGAIIITFFTAISISFRSALHLTKHQAAPVPPEIGKHIRLLLLIQAAFCASTGLIAGSLAAMLLVILWPISRELGRWFYAS
jgi:hypothetical protein